MYGLTCVVCRRFLRYEQNTAISYTSHAVVFPDLSTFLKNAEPASIIPNELHPMGMKPVVPALKTEVFVIKFPITTPGCQILDHFPVFPEGGGKNGTTN